MQLQTLHIIYLHTKNIRYCDLRGKSFVFYRSDPVSATIFIAQALLPINISMDLQKQFN